MDMRTNVNANVASLPLGSRGIPHLSQSTIVKHGQHTPSTSPDGRMHSKVNSRIRHYVEVWDYAGGARFRGFVADKGADMRTMFIFFDRGLIGMDLKPGLMTILELASSEHFECDRLIVCVDRSADETEVRDLTKSLGWVGFDLTTLDEWTTARGCVSDRYIFLAMDV